MSQCECIERCPFFNGEMPGELELIEIIKNNYCLKFTNQCARYQVFKAIGRDGVPKDLHPVERSRVKEILAKYLAEADESGDE